MQKRFAGKVLTRTPKNIKHIVDQRRRCSLLQFLQQLKTWNTGPVYSNVNFPPPGLDLRSPPPCPACRCPPFSDRSPALIASTVLSIVLPTCGTTSPCTAHSRHRRQADARCQSQENSSRENHLLAIHTDQPAKPEYMRRPRMRVKHHKIAAAAPIKFFSR